MNLNPITLLMFLVGFILAYGAVRNKDPRDVLREAMGKEAVHGPLGPPPIKSYIRGRETPPATPPPGGGGGVRVVPLGVPVTSV